MSKIQIWKRITTGNYIINTPILLYLICQRYKFESESQRNDCALFLYGAVFNMSKIQIWKRITTTTHKTTNHAQLYLICQRYKFESESQQIQLIATPKYAVFNMSKIQIWKRITTKINENCKPKRLYLICQRYKFESESQQRSSFLSAEEGCI